MMAACDPQQPVTHAWQLAPKPPFSIDRL